MNRKEDLLNAAARLFYTRGFRATGIDDILAETGAAKATLYHHFPSKEALVDAVLARQDERFRRWIERETGDISDPRRRVLALFDALEGWFAQGWFNGCLFINAAAEHEDRASPVRLSVAAHKTRVREALRRWLIEAGYRDPATLSRQLALLLEGAVVTANIHHTPEAARHAKAAARVLLDNARTTPRPRSRP